MNIHQITFSPTGGTRRVSESICKAFDVESYITELCTKQENLKYPDINVDDLVVISMPVYAGRVPALAVERLKGVKANGAKCVIVAVYGNRAYEDALIEMQDVATEIGFQVIAAVAAISEHSICRMYGAGRPDDGDAKVLASFGLDIINKLNDTRSFEPLALQETDHTNKVALALILQLMKGVLNVEFARANVLRELFLLTISKLSIRNYASAVCDVFLFVLLKQEA